MTGPPIPPPIGIKHILIMSSIGHKIAERDSEMMIEEPSWNVGLNPFLVPLSSIAGSREAREKIHD